MTDIKGYRVLTDEQKEQINHLKEREADLLLYLNVLFKQDGIDKRWLSIARTNIEQGFMAAVRCITQPDTVEF